MSLNSKGACFLFTFLLRRDYDGGQNFEFQKLRLANLHLIKSHLDLPI